MRECERATESDEKMTVEFVAQRELTRLDIKSHNTKLTLVYKVGTLGLGCRDLSNSPKDVKQTATYATIYVVVPNKHTN